MSTQLSIVAAAPLVMALAAQDAPPSADALRAGHERMVATLAQLRDEAVRANPIFGIEPLEDVRKALAAIPEGHKPKQRWQLLRELGAHLLRLGAVEDAISAYDQARLIVEKHPKVFPPNEAADTAFDLGLACLRRGEGANCIAQHCEASCILPIAGCAVHQKKNGATRAIALFEWLAQHRPEHSSARWLLNLSAMHLGEHPAKAPENLRIDFARLESEGEFARFVDVAGELGLATPSLGGGIVTDDFDGDGWIDLVNCSSGPHEQLRYWAGTADAKFVERTVEAGLAGILGGQQLTQADFDNDGDLDLFVLRGAGLRQHGCWPNSLLRNEGGERFVDVTFALGLAEPMLPTSAAAWADFDRDGDLDLFVGNQSSREQSAPSQLWRNDGARFVDVAAAAGVTNDRNSAGAAWGDVDSDGFPELYVSNSGEANRLYRNKGDGVFEDLAKKSGVESPIASSSTWFFDYDNDGALDLFVASCSPSLAPYVSWVVSGSGGFEPQALYKGDGRGGFRNVALEVGLARPNCTQGASHGDLDNDGFEDIHLATGYAGYEALMPNLTLHNRGGQRFADVSLASGMAHLQKGHGVALLDFERDGDLDVHVDLGGVFPGDGFANALFRNPGHANRWLEVRLEGRRSNRSAIGARVRVEVREGEALRSIHRAVASSSSSGGNPLALHIGLGAAERVERLEVEWPAGGERQRFGAIEAGRRVHIVEGDAQLR